MLLVCRQPIGSLEASVNLGDGEATAGITRAALYRLEGPSQPEALVVKDGSVALTMPAVSAALLVLS